MGTEPPVDAIDGRYEVGRVIGRGAMGEVRRGRDIRLGRVVAIKCLRADLAADGDVRARFEDEARSAARLTHPAIVTVFDSGEWDGVPYLVMECLPGRTLADELMSGPLPPDRVCAIATEIAGALEAAHALGVIHRDVKPGNILLTDTGGVKLADFGIAKSTETLDHTVVGMIVGTPAYLAPERLAGEPATARSDLYSLGVVLYEALSGEKPFQGDTPIVLAHAIHTATPVPIADRFPGAYAALASVIDRAMAKDPADRPVSASAMVAGLGPGVSPAVTVESLPVSASPATDVLSTRPTTAIESHDATAAQRWWRDRSRGERRVIGAASVVAILAVIVAGWTFSEDGSTPPSTTVAPTSVDPPSLPKPLDDAIRQLEEAVQP